MQHALKIFSDIIMMSSTIGWAGGRGGRKGGGGGGWQGHTGYEDGGHHKQQERSYQS